MKYIFLLPLILWGCGDALYTSPVKSIAIKIAAKYCEPNQGISWIQSKTVSDKYKAQFRCTNGLQSDWQEMKEEENSDLPAKVMK